MAAKEQKAEDMRARMMGLDKFNPTTFQKRLRTIVMCKPLIRQYKSDRMYDQQERFFELKAKFISATDPVKVEQYGKALVAADQRLSERQS